MAQQSHPPSPVVLFLIICLGIFGGYVYYSQVTSDLDYAVPVAAGLNDESFLQFKDMSFDFSLFTDPSFSSLRTIGEYPVRPGVTGKQDLFSTY